MATTTRPRAATRAVVLGAVLGLALSSVGCGDHRASGPAGTADIAGVVGEDGDNPTPAPGPPILQKGCSQQRSPLAAARLATDMAWGNTTDRAVPSGGSALVRHSIGTVTGTIVRVEKGAVEEYRQSAVLPEAGDELHSRLMADVVIRVEKASSGLPAGVAPGRTVRVPMAVWADGPPADQFPDELATAHANLVNDLDCALPRTRAELLVGAVSSTGTGAGGGVARVELPDTLWFPDPAAVVLEVGDRELQSLDAMIDADEVGRYYGGAQTIDELHFISSLSIAGPGRVLTIDPPD
jgi:hypothetical protein